MWFARVISIALMAGRVLLNSRVSFSSQAHASVARSLSFSLTSPPVEICGVRILTVNVRVSKCAGAVSTFSNIKRRSSALTVLVVSFFASPKVTVTL